MSSTAIFESRIWKAAFYIRLSKDDIDRGENESVSISNQREILKEFLKLHPDIEHVDTYSDDGVSGTTFDRPGFSRLKQDIELKKIDCVIVKDLSRFGRNYSEGGDLIDNYFTQKGVRFISVNNGIDTLSDGMNSATRFLTIGMSNLINESYVASTSVNIRGTLNNHRRQGKFIGAFACYGYKKNPQNRHNLIVDEEAAEIVRFIFREYLGGRGILGIVKKLNDMGISNPTKYKQQHGLNFNSVNGNDGLWCDRTVRRILQNQMYIGNMVQGVNTKISYKINKCRAVPKDERIVVENTHEPIIEKEKFETVQSMLKRNIHSKKAEGKIDLFSGLVFCADCGKAMHKKTNTHSYGVYRYYKCTTKGKKSYSACTNHTVRIDYLEKAVFDYLKTMIALAVDCDKVIKQVKSSREAQENDSFAKTLSAQKKERTQYLSMIDNLYPSWQKGFLSQEEYLRQKEQLNNRLSKINGIISKLSQSQKQGERANEPVNSFASHFIQYRTIEKLTRPLLLEFVDKILVHSDGSITVVIKCNDVFENIYKAEKNENAA